MLDNIIDNPNLIKSRNSKWDIDKINNNEVNKVNKKELYIKVRV